MRPYYAKTKRILGECETLVEQLRERTERLHRSIIDPTDPGRIRTEPQVREPRMPWDSPRESRPYRPHDICLTPDPCRTCDPRASLRPLLTWALVVFLAGLVSGLFLRIIPAALGAEGSTSYRSFAVEPSAARAELVRREAMPETEAAVPRTAQASARANSHADDDPAGSEAAMAPQPSVLTTHGLAVTPPASAVLTVTRSGVEQMSRSAAIRHGLDPDWYAALIFCESSFRANARGAAGEIGAAQWMPSTWNSNAPRLSYVPADIHDPAKNVELAAFVISQDGGWRWTCAR